jgi:hypothetical protein
MRAPSRRALRIIFLTVTDSSGAWVSGVTVTVLSTSIGISAVNQAVKNRYSIFPQLQVGLSDSFLVAAAGSRNGT